MQHHSVVQSLLGHRTSQVVLDPTKCAKRSFTGGVIVAGISKTSETTVQTCDISSRWHVKLYDRLEGLAFSGGILFVNTSK